MAVVSTALLSFPPPPPCPRLLPCSRPKACRLSPCQCLSLQLQRRGGGGGEVSLQFQGTVLSVFKAAQNIKVSIHNGRK